MDLGIENRKALITGGSGDIGRATAEALLAEGVRVVLTDVAEDRLEQTVADVGHGVTGVAADLSTREGAEQLRSDLDQDIDILVHAAGVTGAKGDPLEIDEDDWKHALDVDLMSAVRISRAFVPAMADAGWGRVVYVVSENVAQPYPDEVVYNVAKAGVLTFSKSVSMAYAPRGVLVNCVAPAFIETNMTDGMMQKRADERGVSTQQAVESFLEEQRPHLVLKRRGRPEEVAAAIAFLCSERASFVVGSNYRVDGGSVQSLNL
jgi:NAD(P)-dependent dehydrogenase (short-subunit alcohol dehydrogenase family)